jgi:uroporphyrinogen-III synthase
MVYAPAMRIVPPAEDAALHDATKRCLAEPVEVVVATTPAALHGWLEAADGWELGRHCERHCAVRTSSVEGLGLSVRSAGSDSARPGHQPLTR